MEKQPYTSELNTKIVIQEEVKTRSQTGEEKASYSDLIGAWAKKLQEDAKEDVDGKVRQLINNRYLIRYRAEVLDKTKTLYVMDAGQRYRIHYVKEAQKNTWLEILCTVYE
jgi:head-tail adaptor